MRMRLLCDKRVVAEGGVADRVIDHHASDERLALVFSQPVAELDLATFPSTRWEVELIPDYMDLPGTEQVR